MPRRTTSSSSALENLKREAKRWLKELRGNVADARARLDRMLPAAPAIPTLRDVQLALAREHGFAGWSELKAQLTANQHAARPTIADYQRKAVNLLAAYRTGAPEAMERHWRDTWHRRTWETMRRYVQLDLGRNAEADGGDPDITIDDARTWVARDHGFESWTQLLAEVGALQATKRPIAATLLRVYSAHDPSLQEERTRDWDVAVELLESGRYTALDANGQMTDEVLDRVSRIGQVTALGLTGSSMLTAQGFRHLSRLSELRRLDLGGTAVVDDDLSALRDLRALERLDLFGTRVTDVGVASVAACRQLSRINLAGTRTGDGAIKALAGMSQLTHFRSGNSVTDAGIPLLREFPVFKSWRDGTVSLALLSPDAEPNLLSLRGTFTDRGMRQFQELDGLFALNIDDSSLPITAAGLATLVTLPNLGFLAFDATDEAMPYIAAMPRLRFLMCQDTIAGDDGFTALSASRSIEYIWGRRCHNLRGRGFTALASMPALRALSVSCKNVDDDALASLAHFPALRELMPMDVPDDGYRHIGLCEQLESLVLMYCRETGDAATAHITRLPRLSSYFASYTRITDRTPELLATMPSLAKIELVSCAGVTNSGVAALATAPRLRELQLSGMQHVTRDATINFPSSIRVRYSP
jgi:hypothetical protein